MTTLSKSRVRRSIEACLEYIGGLQSSEGCWTDWELPPGTSSTWTTAYVGYQLRFLPQDLRARFAGPRHASSRQLLQSQFPDEGWGYNETVESDADSTALAILFLASEGQPVSEGAYRRLRGFQRPDGGFSTYINQGVPNSWTISHPDVTPVVLLALLTKYPRDAAFIERGMGYVVKQRTPEGLWHSFWWDSYLYGTAANLSLLSAAWIQPDIAQTRNTLLRVKPRKAFETALLISCMLYIDLDAFVFDLADRLIGVQQANGSWQSEPILRVTRRDCFDPWMSNRSGVLFADPQRIFTSATALAALCRVDAVMPG